MDKFTPPTHLPFGLPGNHLAGQFELKTGNDNADAFLRALPEDGRSISHGILISKIWLSNQDYYNTKQFLKNKGLITEQQKPYLPTKLCLTPEGKHFIDNGGFGKEQKREEGSLKIKRLTRTVFIICLVGMLVSIIAFFKIIYFY